jgi:nucleoside-diphosphate-sugar epimerase
MDFARAIVLATERAAAGSIYNVVDDHPAPYREVFGYLAAHVDAPEPVAGGPPVPSLAASNERLRSELGWEPAYSSFRSGLAG